MILLGSQICDALLEPDEDGDSTSFKSEDDQQPKRKQQQQQLLRGETTDTPLVSQHSLSTDETKDHHFHDKNTFMKPITPVSSPMCPRATMLRGRQQPMTQGSVRKRSSLKRNKDRTLLDTSHKQESSFTLCATTVSSLGEDFEHAAKVDRGSSDTNQSYVDLENYWLLRIPTCSNLINDVHNNKTIAFLCGSFMAKALSFLPFGVQAAILAVGLSMTWLFSCFPSLHGEFSEKKKIDNNGREDSPSANNAENQSLDQTASYISHLPPEGLTLLPISSPLTFEGRSSYDESSVLGEDFLTPPMTPDIRCRTGRSPQSVTMPRPVASHFAPEDDLELIRLHRSKTLEHLGRIHAPFPNMEQDSDLWNRVTPSALKLSSAFVEAQADFLMNVDAALHVIQTASGMQYGIGPFSTSVARVERAMVARYLKLQEESIGQENDNEISLQEMKMASSSASLQRLKLELFQMMLLCLKNLEDLLKLLPRTNSIHNMSGFLSPNKNVEALDFDPTIYHFQSILDSVRRSYLSSDDAAQRGYGGTPITTTVTLSFLTDCRQQLASRLSRFVGRVFRPVSRSHSNPTAVVGLCRRLKEVTTSTNDMTLYLAQAAPNHQGTKATLSCAASKSSEGKEFAMLLAKLDAACVALWCAQYHKNKDAAFSLNMDQIRRDILGGPETMVDENSMETDDSEPKVAKQTSQWLSHGRELLAQSMALCEGMLSRTIGDADDNLKIKEASVSNSNPPLDSIDTVQEYEGSGNGNGVDSSEQPTKKGLTVDEELHLRQQKDPSLVLVYSGRSTDEISTKQSRRKRILRSDFSNLSAPDDPSFLLNELKNRLKLFDTPNEVNANDSENDEDDCENSEYDLKAAIHDVGIESTAAESLDSTCRDEVSNIADGLTFVSVRGSSVATNFLSELTQAQEMFGAEKDAICSFD